MVNYKVKSRALFLVLCVSGLALTACSTQGKSTRYGAEQAQQDRACGRYVSSSCETALVPGGYVVEHYQIQQPAYHVETCCYEEPPVVYTPPPVEEPPVIELPPEPLPPITPQPPVYTPPAPLPPVVITPPPPLRPSCPEGTIPGYGGEGCIPIAIPRK